MDKNFFLPIHYFLKLFRGVSGYFFKCSNEVRAVSYTHLDVYKRQMEYNAEHVEKEPFDCQMECSL